MINKLFEKYSSKSKADTSELYKSVKASRPEIEHGLGKNGVSSLGDKAHLKENEENFQEELETLLKKSNEVMNKYCNLYDTSNEGKSKFTIDPLNKEFLQKKRNKLDNLNTAGKNWFNMKAPELTPEVERDLKALQLRHIIDPSRFYKKPDRNGLPRFFQIGTIHTELTQGKKFRLKKSEKKASLAEEFLETDTIVNYSKRKFKEVQQKKVAIGRKKKRMNEFKLKSRSKKREYIAK